MSPVTMGSVLWPSKEVTDLPRASTKVLALAIALTAGASTQAQIRPKVAWTEPGSPPAYGFLHLAPDGAPREIGQPVAWRWFSVAPNGLYAAYVPIEGPHLIVRDLTSGVDQELTQLRHDARTQIHRAVWEGSLLWLVVLEDGKTNVLYAVDPKVPAATRASGRYSIASFSPVAGSDVAYAISSQGPQSQYQSLMLCRSNGAPPRVLGDTQLVVGGRIIESAHRVAFFARRPDRAGLVLNVYDRDLDEEFTLNPDAGAFLPVFAPGFEAVAYTTREGIVYRTLAGEPRLLMRHLPDRRYAWGYHFTPDGSQLIVEVPANPDKRVRRFLRIPVANPADAAAVLDVEGDPRGEASTITFLPQGTRALVVVPRQNPRAPQGMHLVDVATGASKALGAGTLIDALASSSGRTLAIAMNYPEGMAEDEIAILVLDTAAPEPRRSLTVQGARTPQGLAARGLEMAFSPGGERLLIKASPVGDSGVRAFLVDGPGQPAVPVPGATLVHEARWARSGEAVLLSAVTGYTTGHAPVMSLVAVDATGRAGSDRLISGAARITEMKERPDGGLTAVVEARPATRKLLVSTKPDEALVLTQDHVAMDPVWSPDGARLLFREQVAPGYWAVYAVSPGVQPIVVSGDVPISQPPVWLSDGQRVLLLGPGPTDQPGLYGYIGHAAGGAPRALGAMENATLVTGSDILLYHAAGPPAGIYMRRLTDPPSEPALVAEGYEAIVPDPTGTRGLVFREVQNGLEAAVVSLAAGLPTPLPGIHRYLVWAPSGSGIASLSAGEPGRLTFYGADGSIMGEVAASPEAIAFDPAGGRVAGTLAPSEGPAVTVLWDVTGQEIARVPWPAQLRPLPALGQAGLDSVLPTRVAPLSWSPDGSRSHIVGLSEDGLYEMRTILWEERANIPSVFSGSLADFAWSPDGTYLAALTYRVVTAPQEGTPVEPPMRLSVIRGHEGRVYNASGHLFLDGFAWLTDGRLALWASSGAGKEAIGTFVANPDGTGLFPIAPQPGTVWPTAERPATRDVRYTTGGPGR